jgi:hypothetical protein
MKPGTLPANTSNWLTTSEMLDTFSVSHATLESFVKKGHLNPVKGKRTTSNNSTREVWLFNPAEFSKVPWSRRDKSAADPNEIAARAFDLMEDGVDMRGLVRRLRLTPDRVIELRAQWEDFGGAGVILGRTARGELAEIVGPFEDVAGLVQRVRSIVSEASPVPCVRCLEPGGSESGGSDSGGLDLGESSEMLDLLVPDLPGSEAAHAP